MIVFPLSVMSSPPLPPPQRTLSRAESFLETLQSNTIELNYCQAWATRNGELFKECFLDTEEAMGTYRSFLVYANNVKGEPTKSGLKDPRQAASEQLPKDTMSVTTNSYAQHTQVYEELFVFICLYSSSLVVSSFHCQYSV